MTLGQVLPASQIATIKCILRNHTLVPHHIAHLLWVHHCTLGVRNYPGIIANQTLGLIGPIA